MKYLPLHLSLIKRTDEFNEKIIPLGFLEGHTIKPGIWGKIIVLEGELEYRIFEPDIELHVLSPNYYGVVEPQIMHEMKPRGRVRFFIEFYE